VRRLVAQELVLSFVPDPEQRLWRTLTRRKQPWTKDGVRFQNRREAVLEQMHIKLSGQMSDLLGVSGRRMLEALAEGATDLATVAALADPTLRATQEQLKFLEEQMDKLKREIAELLTAHSAAVERLAEVPGLGVESAQQIIAEVGPTAAVFPSEKALASWVGVCPGEEVTAGEAHRTRSPKGNRNLRRLLNQAAHAAGKMKGSIFEVVFHRLVPRMEYNQAIWTIAHRLCRLIWKILHQGVRYEERGPSVSAKAQRARLAKMIRELTKAGFVVQLPKLEQATPARARGVFDPGLSRVNKRRRQNTIVCATSAAEMSS
jgi:transposase